MEQTMRDVVDEIQLADNDVGDCVGVDYGSLEKDIQAQRVVALEEKRLEAAIEELLKLETEVRSAADVPRTRRVVVAIVQLCYEARAWKTLNDQIFFLSRRQAQPTQAITAMVQQAAFYINDTPDLETRNELIETLNSISAGKGPIKKCWFMDLALQDTTQSCSRKSMLDDSKQALLPTSCQHHHENAQGQPQAEQFEELSLEDFHSPTCGSRPSTPPPQQETKPRDVAPWLSLLPIRRGANVIQKPSRPVRRRLFDPPSPAELEDFLSELEQSDQKRFRDRYNFDPLTEEPLPGRFEWVPVQPRLARALSIDSNLEGKRPELGATMSA